MTTAEKTFMQAVFWEPLDLAKAQPHQILLSTGSIALMGSFFSSSGILDPLIGYCVAGGVEWAYLKGMATDSKAPTAWGKVLNWSAFLCVVLWGVLSVAETLGAFDAKQPSVAWWSAVFHVVPLAWIGLCSAMTHQAASTTEARETQRTTRIEQERQRALRAERDAMALDKERREYEQALELQRTQALEDAKMHRAVTLAKAKAELSQNSPVTPVTVVSRSVTTLDRDGLRAAVVTVVTQARDSGAAVNVTQEAAKIGISRPLWYKLKNEAVAAGELPEGA